MVRGRGRRLGVLTRAQQGGRLARGEGRGLVAVAAVVEALQPVTETSPRCGVRRGAAAGQP